jgi:hypothetical protein
MAGSHTGFKVFGLVGLAAVGLYALHSVQNAADNLRYTLKEVKISYKNFKLLISIDLIISNPTTQDLKFKQFTGKIYADNTFLGYADIPNQTNIKAKSDTIVNLSTVIPTTSVIDIFINNVAKLKLPTTGKLVGLATIGNVNIKIDETFNFNEPAKPKTTAKK